MKRGARLASGTILLAIVAGGLTATTCRGRRSGSAGSPIEVPAGIDPSEWTRLLLAYVDDRGLVDYARLERDEGESRGGAVRVLVQRLAFSV